MTPSPRQTVQDLRQAAANVRTYGYATHEYVDTQGRVCAVGALGLATGAYRRNWLPQSEIWDFAHNTRTPHSSDDRMTAATNALAPLLPIACPEGQCCPPAPLLSTETPYTSADMFHERIRSNPQDIVFHFNDFICEGGEALATLFEQAAEKIEANLP